MTVMMLVALCGDPAFAQGPDKLEPHEQAYVDAFVSVLAAWEDGEIAFEKTDEAASKFQDRLDGFMMAQATSPLEELIPIDFLKYNWERLPETVRAERPLSKGAYFVLVGGIVDAAGQLSEMDVPPTPESLADALAFSLYLTLGAAEEEAELAGTSRINATAIRRAGMWFFSLGWPFCCAVDDR